MVKQNNISWAVLTVIYNNKEPKKNPENDSSWNVNPGIPYENNKVLRIFDERKIFTTLTSVRECSQIRWGWSMFFQQIIGSWNFTQALS